MASARKGRAAAVAAPSVVAVSLPGLTGIKVPAWLRVLAADVALPPGGTVSQALRVPVADANKVLKASVRFVADLPAGVSGDVVWTQGDAELLVRTDTVNLACAPGLVSISLAVACDQLPRGGTVVVPLAVGSEERPAGLVMSAFARPAGPEVVTSVWAEALTAFAWEALVHLAQQLAAVTGKDRAGRGLVPAEIGAAQNLLIVLPMARHELAARSRGTK